LRSVKKYLHILKEAGSLQRGTSGCFTHYRYSTLLTGKYFDVIICNEIKIIAYNVNEGGAI